MVEGGSNSKFFHSIIQLRRSKSMINRMTLESGEILDSTQAIHDAVVEYFQEALTSSGTQPPRDLGSLLKPVVSEEDSRCSLRRPPSLGELREALDGIPLDSCPSPDGYGSSFFCGMLGYNWYGFIGGCHRIFQRSSPAQCYTSLFIVTIPKEEHPRNFLSLTNKSLFNGL